MVDEKQIERLMKRHFDVTGNISINNITGTVSVSGDVKLKPSIKIGQLPVKFEHVGGGFHCNNNQLSSLEGAPSHVGRSFFCDKNQLSSLAGAPSHVGGSFFCENNQLASFEGAPSHVGGSFFCENNQLASLEGAPSHVGGDFYCNRNQLASLQGAPSQVGGGFYLWDNLLRTLDGAPQTVGKDFDVTHNPLSSLEGAPSKIGGVFIVDYKTPMPLLKLLSYQKVKMIDAPVVLTQVLDKYAGAGRRGAISAAKEIMQAGEQLRQLQGLDHNPFEANTRW